MTGKSCAKKHKAFEKVRKPLKNIDDFNSGMMGMKGRMNNASIFTAPGLEKAVDIDNKRRKSLR